jgi:hypothetical protein
MLYSARLCAFCPLKRRSGASPSRGDERAFLPLFVRYLCAGGWKVGGWVRVEQNTGEKRPGSVATVKGAVRVQSPLLPSGQTTRQVRG